MFFVTSGVYSISGKYTTEERLAQTIQTALSIRNKIPDAHILLLDGGKKSLTQEHIILLKTVYTDVIDFSTHPVIKWMHDQNINVAMIKGPCEVFMLKTAAEEIKKSDDNYDLFFKISGRYQLSDEFDINNYVRDTYVFKNKDPGIMYHRTNPEENIYPDNINKYYTEYQYKTRLYSFPRSLLDTAIKDYHSIYQRIILCYDDYGFTDIEHATYYVLNPDTIKEIPIIGLEGPQAENGITVRE